jgi:hypothetical protein
MVDWLIDSPPASWRMTATTIKDPWDGLDAWIGLRRTKGTE